MKLLIARELLNGTKRGAVTDAMKVRTWAAADGLCMWCQTSIACMDPGTDYDHRVPLALNGADDEANIAPIHKRPCHREKTGEDIRRIAKAKRQRKLIEEPEAPARKIKSPGFRKDVSKGFDGKIRRRA